MRWCVLILAVSIVDSGSAPAADPEDVYAAATLGKLSVVKSWIKEGGSADTRVGGNTLLMGAVRHRQVKVVQYLIEAGADVNTKNDYGWTPLLTATVKADAVTAKVLIGKGAELDAANGAKWTPLMVAEAKSEDALMDLLKKAGAKKTTAWAPEALTFLSGVTGPALEGGPIPKYPGFPLSLRPAKRPSDLLKQGVPVDVVDFEGNSALVYAANLARVAEVKWLIEQKADVDLVNQYGESALFFAARGGHSEIVTLLLEAGASAKRVDESGQTPLMEAAESGDEKSIAKLIAYKADVNATDSAGYSVLARACVGGKSSIVKLLLKHGADVNTQVGNVSLLTYAERNSPSDKVIEVLKKAGAKR
jgi:ankyrin repeat protein